MRLLRILLQLLILAFFLPILFLVLVQRPLELNALVAISGMFAFLLILTLLLREHTANRRNPSHEISRKVMTAFIGLAGGGLLWLAWLIASRQYHPSGGRSRLLGLSIELIGPWLPAAVLFALGLQMLWLASRAWRER